jgi:transposase
MNTKLHAVTDANGRPLSFFMTAGQVSDYTGAAALLDDLPKAQWLLGDRGYAPTGSEMRWKPRASSPASQIGHPATNRSGTTSAATGAAAASRSCSAA